MDLCCLVVGFLLCFVVVVCCFICSVILLPLFYSNDQLQKQLDETRKTLKYKEDFIHNLSREKEDTFTRLAQIECSAATSKLEIMIRIDIFICNC